MKKILEAKNITKQFTSPQHVSVLKEIDFTVYGGESIAIMGRSGEGKSTLLQILGTLELATSGSLTIAGHQINRRNISSIRRNHLAFVFQSYHLLEDYSVLDNILMPAKINRQPTHVGSEAYKRAIFLLNEVELSHRQSFDTKLLSGGEKQRVAIARALCNDPDLILADEPSGNLDVATSEIIHRLLLSFAKKESKALVLVTHNQSLADMCNKKYMLEKGTLIPA